MRWRHVPQYANCPAHCHNQMPQGPPNDRRITQGSLKVASR